MLGLIPLTEVVDLVGMDVPELTDERHAAGGPGGLRLAAPIKGEHDRAEAPRAKPSSRSRRPSAGSPTARPPRVAGTLTDVAIEFAGIVRSSSDR